MCRPDQQDVFGVAPGETVKIPCDVIGDPSGNMRFEWVFNTTTEWYPDTVLGVTSSKHGWTRAYVQHIPKSDMDFGSIMCWATNNIGNQLLSAFGQLHELSKVYLYFREAKSTLYFPSTACW